MTDIELKTVRDLSPGEWEIWDDIRAANPVYASPYFAPEFAQAVASVRDDVEVAVLKQGSATVGFFPFQRGRLNLGKPLGGKLSDYHGPLAGTGAMIDPRSLLRSCGLAAWDFDHLVGPTELFEPFVT
ncbi:MAG TPA: hypothetical protein VFV87_03655, partial [Pirellulaceae bacterium]|nr:hypothetical protein [Pirellulaceae bacterium]